MARVHGKRPAQQINIYDVSVSVAAHVCDKDRRYVVLVIDMPYDFVFGKMIAEEAVNSFTLCLADILPTKKIVTVF